MEDTLRVLSLLPREETLRLNPCFNGRYSQSAKELFLLSIERVLILVLMEDTLREIQKPIKVENQVVLILVLMEDTLREQRLMFLCIRVFGVCSSF